MRNRYRPWFSDEPKQWINPALCEALDNAIIASRTASIFGRAYEGPSIEEILRENARKVYWGS